MVDLRVTSALFFMDDALSLLSTELAAAKMKGTSGR